MQEEKRKTAYYHLPGLFEFYDFYKVFLPIYRSHPEYFYDWCKIGSVYGAPADCLWGGGRVGFGGDNVYEVEALMKEYCISSRLTFSNSLLNEKHLTDVKCNELCRIFNKSENAKNGVIVHSDLLLRFLKKEYPNLYFVSSTTKVITDKGDFINELNREEFSYVVPDFRLNKQFQLLEDLNQNQRDKIELLCNECCSINCAERRRCYENVSRKALGEDVPDHVCMAPGAEEGYLFSKAMINPSFIGLDDILEKYLPVGITNFKIEGRSLGSALILEFLLYYMTKPEWQLRVREMVYLDNTLDLF